MKSLHLFVALLLGAVAITPGPAAQAAGLSHNGTLFRVAERQEIDADRAARIAREARGGRVLDVRRKEREGRPAWRVRLLDQGRVRSVWVDARSGRILD